MLRGQGDVKALNIPRQGDVKLNELAKQILMLLPLLLLLLLLLYVTLLHHELIGGRETPPYNNVVSTYSRSSSRSIRGNSIKICFGNSYYEKLSNELPTYQVLPNQLPNLAIH